jgi:hypothetical protein
MGREERNIVFKEYVPDRGNEFVQFLLLCNNFSIPSLFTYDDTRSLQIVTPLFYIVIVKPCGWLNADVLLHSTS